MLFDSFSHLLPRTIRWIIQACLAVGFPQMPPMGIIPLGTGNDLARMFGWGKGYSGEPLTAYVEGAIHAIPKSMDLYVLQYFF